MQRKPLNGKTLERLAKEWDLVERNGRRFILRAGVFEDPCGEQRDAIEVFENIGTREESFRVILL